MIPSTALSHYGIRWLDLEIQHREHTTRTLFQREMVYGCSAYGGPHAVLPLSGPIRTGKGGSLTAPIPWSGGGFLSGFLFRRNSNPLLTTPSAILLTSNLPTPSRTEDVLPAAPGYLYRRPFLPPPPTGRASSG